MFVKCLVKYINNISQFLFTIVVFIFVSYTLKKFTFMISTEILINVSGSIDKCIKNAYGDRLKVYIIHLLFDLENHSFR